MKIRSRSMDCKEFLRLTPEFVDDRLMGKPAYKFLEHMENCEECREELHIQYLVSEGMSRLESGAGFNLDEELELKVSSYKKMLARRHTLDVIVYWMEAVSIVAIIFILTLVFLHTFRG